MDLKSDSHNGRDELENSTFISTPSIGNVEIRKMNPETDSLYIHNWVIKDYARFWGMKDKSLNDVKAEYTKLCNNEFTHVYIGSINGIPKFLFEQYNPSKEPVGKHYQVMEGDSGVHLLIAPAEVHIKNFTFEIFSVVLKFIFQDERITRIVIEPDVRNKKMLVLSERIGFQFVKNITLPHKEAALGFCNREK